MKERRVKLGFTRPKLSSFLTTQHWLSRLQIGAPVNGALGQRALPNQVGLVVLNQPRCNPSRPTSQLHLDNHFGVVRGARDLEPELLAHVLHVMVFGESVGEQTG